MSCDNGDADRPTERTQVHLDTGEVVDLECCEPCRRKFAAADWVAVVL